MTYLAELKTRLGRLGYGVKKKPTGYLTFPSASGGSSGYHPTLEALADYARQVEENREWQAEVSQ